MTRLTEHDIAALGTTWNAYERKLRALTGAGLLELAAAAAGVPALPARSAFRQVRVAVIPISSGLGVIPGFAEAVASIARHLGFCPEVFPPDAEGFRQARAAGCEVLIWADDDTYLAESLETGLRVDNGQATGRGFAEALLRMAGQWRLAPASVLVLGAGPVGRAGAAYLLAAGCRVVLCDLDGEKAARSCAELAELRAAVPCAPAGLESYAGVFPCLLDAAPSAACFPVSRLTARACVAAPCVPCPWSCVPGLRLWHDPLQLGTAVMLLAAAFGRQAGR